MKRTKVNEFLHPHPFLHHPSPPGVARVVRRGRCAPRSSQLRGSPWKTMGGRVALRTDDFWFQGGTSAGDDRPCIVWDWTPSPLSVFFDPRTRIRRGFYFNFFFFWEREWGEFDLFISCSFWFWRRGEGGGKGWKIEDQWPILIFCRKMVL